jgi:hypothetical protein
MTIHHANITLWLLFFLGQVIHALKLGKTDKQGFAQHFKAGWVDILIRLSLCGVMFALWLNKPDMLTKLIGGIGISEDFVQPGPATSFAFGLAADSLLDFLKGKNIPVLGQLIPDEKEAEKP